MQITIDGKSVRPSVWTADFAKQLSRDIVDLCGMHIFYGPEAFETDDAGLLVCFTMIAESHISLHLNRKTGFAYVDVFTCKAMPAEVESLITERLALPSPTVNKLSRGDLP